MTSIRMAYGTVEYCAELQSDPVSTTRSGYAGFEGRPAHHKVTFSIAVEHQGKVDFSNHITLTTCITGFEIGAPYSEIEATAARTLAPMLREIARSVEEAVEEGNSR